MVGKGEVANERKANCDDALDGEEHAPAVQATEVTQFQYPRCEKTAKSAGQWSCDNVEGQAESELASAIPTRQVVSNSWQHSRFEYSQQEANCGGVGNVVCKGHTNRDDAETEGNRWDVPTRTDDLAEHVGGEFEQNIRNVECREDNVVVVSFQFEIMS